MSHCFMNNYDYEFEILDNDLGYFQKKSLMKDKIDHSFNRLFFVQDNKVLSVKKCDEMTNWLPYEKAKFFYSFFNVPQNHKYTLINESDEFFYGLIDGFPCVFNTDYNVTLSTLAEYAENEDIFQYGIGDVSCECEAIISLKEVRDFVKQDSKVQKSFVMEESSQYGEVEESVMLSELFLDWYALNAKEKEHSLKISYFYFGCASILLISSVLLNLFF